MTEEGRTLPTGRERILLVDDEQVVVNLCMRMLSQLGYEVTGRTDPLDALQTFRSNPRDFDLLFTDYSMPNLTGTDLAVEALKIRPDLPIILCTGYSEIATESEAKALGIRGYLTKPVERKDLAQTIRKTLDEAAD